MMILKVQAQITSDKEILVMWATGLKNRGVLQINAENINKDELVLSAELTAIRHLLFVKKVFNREVIDGTGLTLKVSRGAVKKLAKSRSTKKHLFAYSAFMRIRLSEAKIIVDKSLDFLPSVEECAHEKLNVNKNDFLEHHEKISTPPIGEFYLTFHAIEQYLNHLKHDEPARPLKSLLKRLSHPSLSKQSIPKNVIDHKQKKYGDSNIEVWGHASCNVRFLMTVSDKRRTLVTTFLSKT